MPSYKEMRIDVLPAKSQTVANGLLTLAVTDGVSQPKTYSGTIAWQRLPSTTSRTGTGEWAYVPLATSDTLSPSATTITSTDGPPPTEGSSVSTWDDIATEAQTTRVAMTQASKQILDTLEAFDQLNRKVAKMELLAPTDDDRITDYAWCPRCLGALVAPRIALSRVDNATHICSECGLAEFVESLSDDGMTPIAEWPVVPE